MMEVETSFSTYFALLLTCCGLGMSSNTAFRVMNVFYPLKWITDCFDIFTNNVL